VDCASFVSATNDVERQTWWSARDLLLVDVGSQFWLFTVFDKDEMSDLTATERKTLKEMIKRELEARRKR